MVKGREGQWASNGIEINAKSLCANFLFECACQVSLSRRTFSLQVLVY